MIIDFETEECIECDIHIRMISALYSIAKNELDQHGTTGFLLTVAQGIEKEARDMTELLSKQAEDCNEQQKSASMS
jgi:hypothetical protein